MGSDLTDTDVHAAVWGSDLTDTDMHTAVWGSDLTDTDVHAAVWGSDLTDTDMHTAVCSILAKASLALAAASIPVLTAVWQRSVTAAVHVCVCVHAWTDKNVGGTLSLLSKIISVSICSH